MESRRSPQSHQLGTTSQLPEARPEFLSRTRRGHPLQLGFAAADHDEEIGSTPAAKHFLKCEVAQR